MDKLTQSELRMQMLAGVITESEYKEKLEEADPGNLMLSNAAKQIYQYIKSNKYNVMLQIDGKVIGANKNAPFTLYSDSKSGKISVRGIGSDQNTVKDTMTKLQNLILGHFNFLEKDGEIQVNFDGMKNASLGSFALRIKPDMLKKGEVTEALNEHYVAGGIVGIGAITQIPSRAKTDYEDAFEHFLGQKYEIKEEMEEEGMKKEDIEEEKTPLTPEQQKELEKAYDQLAAVMGIDPREVAMYVDLNQITKDKASGKLNNEGKEVEEPYNY